MAKSTWWIGLSKNWEVIKRTAWDEPRPDASPDVHLWIKKQETDERIPASNMKGAIIYEYSIWDSTFLKRESFPVNKWSIVEISTPKDLKNHTKILIHLRDPQKIVRTIQIESDSNLNLTQVFTKIDDEISVFDSWETYRGQMS